MNPTLCLACKNGSLCYLRPSESWLLFHNAETWTEVLYRAYIQWKGCFTLATDRVWQVSLLPPFVFDHKLGRHGSVVIVLSPLVSLMMDQVQSLRRRSVYAAIMSSKSSVEEFLVTDEDWSKCLLFCAPEALGVSKWREAITQREFSLRVVTVVVDEAHCVSKWYVTL